MTKTYNFIVLLMGLAVFTAFLATESQASSSQTETSFLSPENGLVIEDSQAKVKKKIKVVVTAYSSCPYETDNTP